MCLTNCLLSELLFLHHIWCWADLVFTHFVTWCSSGSQSVLHTYFAPMMNCYITYKTKYELIFNSNSETKKFYCINLTYSSSSSFCTGYSQWILVLFVGFSWFIMFFLVLVLWFFLIIRTLTQSIGLLSYTYLSRTGLDRIVVPMVSTDKRLCFVQNVLLVSIYLLMLWI